MLSKITRILSYFFGTLGVVALMAGAYAINPIFGVVANIIAAVMVWKFLK
jgi:hypothetical protein